MKSLMFVKYARARPFILFYCKMRQSFTVEFMSKKWQFKSMTCNATLCHASTFVSRKKNIYIYIEEHIHC